MKPFVDTSAFYAILDKSDVNHNKAAKIWRELLAEDAQLCFKMTYYHWCVFNGWMRTMTRSVYQPS